MVSPMEAVGSWDEGKGKGRLAQAGVRVLRGPRTWRRIENAAAGYS
jgi:hypothetical protein